MYAEGLGEEETPVTCAAPECIFLCISEKAETASEGISK